MKYSAICAVAVANWYFCSTHVNMVSQKKAFYIFLPSTYFWTEHEKIYFYKDDLYEIAVQGNLILYLHQSKFTTKIYQFFGGG